MMKKLLICLCALSFLTIIFCPIQSLAAHVQITFTGEVGCSGGPSGCTVIEDPFGMLAGKIAEGDNFEGYFILPATLPVNPPTSEYLVQADFSFPFFIEINGYTWRSNNHSFTIQDDDPFNDFDQYTSQVQAIGQRVTTIGDSFTAGLQLSERHRSLPISTNPLNPPDPSTFGGIQWIDRLQIFGYIDGTSSAAYLITGDIESLSATPVTEPTIDDILNFFNEAVDAGTIEGRGRKPWLANVKLWIFGQMLESAKWLLEHDKTKHACKILKHAYNRSDGNRRPHDFVIGEPVPDLATMISGLMCNLECKDCPIKYTAIINYYKEGEGEEEKSWIEIQLVDEDGNPIAHEKYELYLPDGSVIKGRLDENGIARASGVEPGTADITFPDLDTDSWQRI
jgi:hypothetical protein